MMAEAVHPEAATDVCQKSCDHEYVYRYNF